MSELRTIARHAGTVLAGQLAVMAYGVADTVIAGRHSAQALAALSIGSAVYISVFVALMGILQAQLPVWAELHGAGQPRAIGRSVRQALYLCALTAAVGAAALLWPGPLLRVTGVPEALVSDVQDYLAVLALALPAALLFRLFSTLNQALGKPRLVTWLQVGSLVIKVPLSVWFVFGGAGLPAMGLVGCAWATLAVNYLLLAMALWLVRTDSLYRACALWQPLEPPDPGALAGFARLGIPNGLAIMVEVTSFTLMALFIARMGMTASAGHQIAANMAALLYMVPLSIGIAASARISFWLGAGDPVRARQVIGTGLRLTLGAALVLAALVIAGHEVLASLYAGNNPAVVAMAGSLLVWVAAYHLADALQAVCVFMLRCYRVATAALAVYCVFLWGIGLGGGFLLANHTFAGLGPAPQPQTFWAMGALALALTAATLGWLLRRSVHRPLPASAASA